MKEIKGDLTLLEPAVIIQQVNCQGVMGAGLAKALYTKYPKIRQEYMKLCKWHEPAAL